MQTISTALAAHIAGEVTTLATCWRAVLRNGTVYGFTDFSEDLVVSGVTYSAATGYTPSSIINTNTLSVDNLEVQGLLQSPGITESDLNAGLWDFAEIFIFQVNYSDLTQGILKLTRGHLGEITSRRSDFTAELRGLNDAYSRLIAEIYSPSCRARLGDARCKVVLTPFTATGTAQTISADGRVITDTARTEPGPAGGKTITGVSSAQAAVVTCTAHGFTSGDLILITGVNGVSAQGLQSLNGRNFIVTVTDVDHFSIPVDTRPLAALAANGPTDPAKVYSAYVSGGVATPAGAVGYFTYGLITFTSGLNNGLAMEVQSYVPGTISLRLSLPYSIAVGDTYSMIAGCGKRFSEDCTAKFNNAVNFRGEPFLPGIDQILISGGQAPGQGAA